MVLQDFMEWFVEAVLFLDRRLKRCPSAPPLTFDDVRMDSFRVAYIDCTSSINSTLRENAFSSDLSVICELFLTILLILEDHHSLESPLNPDFYSLIFCRIMVDILGTFVQKGDIDLPDSSPTDYFVPFFRHWLDLQTRFHNESGVLTHQSIQRVFVHMVDVQSRSGRWKLPPESLFKLKGMDVPRRLGDAVIDAENSNKLVDIVKEVQKRYSQEKVREEFDSFEGLKGLMRKIVEKEEAVAQSPPSHNIVTSSTATSSDAVWMIRTLHDLISAPAHSSFHRSQVHPSFHTPVQLIIAPPLDDNETFTVSLFDKEDDDTIANSLSRCADIYIEHRTLPHIVDHHAFVDRLIGALSSSHFILRDQSLYVLMMIVSQIGEKDVIVVLQDIQLNK
ncbi:hypothetical protein BLNAU_5158 [Blattamonas nauphoetae]|uniref:Uncharacterized protein n=1 Tax=Blattamonas nauphoetae TaxID=2049346 RepID=A0ABQ9Y8C8_9EUKA|nr:hypothetical protein BLNAU_5158 [Blattamonas nauphoetae]